MKETYFLICPRCASRNVVNDLSTSMIAWNSSTRYLCRDCQYSAITFPEITEESYPEFVSELKTRTKDDEMLMASTSALKGIRHKQISLGYIIIMATSLSYIFVHYFQTVSNNSIILISMGIAAFAIAVLVAGLLQKPTL